IVLAVLAVFGGFLGVPHVLGHALHIPNLLENWLEPVFASGVAMLPLHGGDHASTEMILMSASTVLAILGILLARRIYANGLETASGIASRFKGVYQLLLNKYYVDEIYHMLIAGPILALSRDALWKIVDVILIDGAVNGSARVVGASAAGLRRMQTGVAQNYALVMMAGIVILVAMVVFPLFR
ncbi:MAG: NADH-quinone oxidoreductase subunit L, partial [Candidatus Kapabacteria bacterium]|nr:NADH-quinone oxidoreductase subunit L [Candidatus Kapabacteria bacterium]